MGCIRSFKHNAELQETRLTVKNGVFRTSETDLLLDFDENWHKCIKDMPAPQNKKNINEKRGGAERSEAKRMCNMFGVTKKSITRRSEWVC